jgi:type I restriction enzyme S subunit
MGERALAVGMPKSPAPPGWKWVALTDVARLESGHTPSRNHPEYWGGEVPWLSIRDAKAHHGDAIHETIENTNALGIENSSARVLPAGTVCLSRTASVGYVVVMGRAMATSQDFVNWVCSKQLEPRFLQYLLIFEGPSLSRFSSGAVHQTIYFPEVKAFHICLPPLEDQRRIVAVLDEAFATIATATAHVERKLQCLSDLKQSMLQKAFSGGLPTDEVETAAA